MPEKKQVWRFSQHGGRTLYGYGFEGHAIAHCHRLNSGPLNHFEVEPVDIGRTQFKQMAKSGAIFDLEAQLAEDTKRRAKNLRDYRTLIHHGNQEV